MNLVNEIMLTAHVKVFVTLAALPGVRPTNLLSRSHQLRWLMTRAINTGGFGTIPSVILFLIALSVSLVCWCWGKSLEENNTRSLNVNTETDGHYVPATKHLHPSTKTEYSQILKGLVVVTAAALLCLGMSTKPNELGLVSQVSGCSPIRVFHCSLVFQADYLFLSVDNALNTTATSLCSLIGDTYSSNITCGRDSFAGLLQQVKPGRLQLAIQ
jgi:hypothetical protein